MKQPTGLVSRPPPDRLRCVSEPDEVELDEDCKVVSVAWPLPSPLGVTEDFKVWLPSLNEDGRRWRWIVGKE